MKSNESDIWLEYLERTIGETEGIYRARALVDLADTYFSARDFTGSLAASTAAQEIFQGEGEELEAAECSRKAACTLAELGRFGDATAHLAQALQTHRRANKEVDIAKCEQLFGQLFRELERPDEALKILRSSHQRFLAAEMEDEAAYCNLQMGYIFEGLGAFDCALIELAIAATGFRKTNVPQYEADSLSTRAELLFRLERFEEAIRDFNKAKRAYLASCFNGNAEICDHRIAEAEDRLRKVGVTRTKKPRRRNSRSGRTQVNEEPPNRRDSWTFNG